MINQDEISNDSFKAKEQFKEDLFVRITELKKKYQHVLGSDFASLHSFIGLIKTTLIIIRDEIHSGTPIVDENSDHCPDYVKELRSLNEDPHTMNHF